MVIYQIMKISIIIPVYNEGRTISAVINELKNFIGRLEKYEFEIIVVNDGSTDETGEILKRIPGIRLVNHSYNKGYGAALKTGVINSSFDWVFFFDSDGQAKPEEMPKILEFVDNYDMVVGARKNKKSSLVRKPGRALLHWLANYLSDQKIPDLNCGFRAVKKEKIKEFLHLLPNSFSLTTTLTLAFQKSGLDVKYVPIEVNKRAGGKSAVNFRHAVKTFFLILRTIVLFSPLRVFMPVSGFLFFLGAFITVIDFTNRLHISNSAVLLYVSSLIIFLFGLLADQLSAIRREIKK